MTNNKLFEKVLIANRGEIAVRVIKTLNKMGIKSIAIYSEADSNALHVQLADEAYYVGPSPATESYLSIENVIAAVRASGAEAVHPGYGFLSENANFANDLKKEGVALIGPSPYSIASMGDKIEAKRIAEEAGVSTVPGYIGIIRDSKQAITIAQKIGYPVMVKAAAGGGGRGMRVVRDDSQMVGAFKSATLEAKSSFSDGRVFIEKFIERPRHIEIQLLADQYGNAICLGERECSIQRQHQKVIEEAPSVAIDDESRKKMYEQVIALAHTVNYFSAGTVEFIMDQAGEFYFLEMNTRLQVEHCVTELVTGIDIVEQMILIAAGEKLAMKQEDVKLTGWAIESRICAEDPMRGFLPSVGRIAEYEEPIRLPGIRIDSGIRAGGEISMFYDSMIAKLCTYGATRQEALDKMQQSLSSYVIRGITHNMGFLEAIITHPRFQSGDINTNFLNEEYPDGFSGTELTSSVTEVFLATSLFIHLREKQRAARIPGQLETQSDRIGTRWIATIDGESYPVVTKPSEKGYAIRNSSTRIEVKSEWQVGSKLFRGEVNGAKINVRIENVNTGYELEDAGSKVKAFVRSLRVAELESSLPNAGSDDSLDELEAPLAGKIIAINAVKGEVVDAGEPLITLEAMKMENIIVAESKVKIAKILVQEGDDVSTGQILIEFEQ